ncbi:MAG: hypothetical protein HXX11_04375 [Desulfuromonadales bacterium]|nr:hypothetical protein [Desulfuromonadales bacterium]
MKRMGFVVGAVALMGLSGCATQGFVRSQADPLAERIGKLEAKEVQLSGMREADSAAVKQANDKAEQALAIANKTAVDVVNANNDVKKADAAVTKAEAAAQRAEAAAARAEKAANEAVQAANEAKQMALKSEKVFKLEQKK